MASLRHPNVVLFLGLCYSPPAIVTGAGLGRGGCWERFGAGQQLAARSDGQLVSS